MWHFDGHTDSFFARSLDTTEPRWSVLVTGDWSAYCGANCWRSDVIGSNKISHTHTLINIPAITHTLTRAQIPYLAARWNAILFTSSHSPYLSPASYLTFYILHDTAIILTPRYYAALWGDRVHWLPVGDMTMGHHDSAVDTEHWTGVCDGSAALCIYSLCIVSSIGRCRESTS